MKNKHEFKVKLGDLVQIQHIPDDGREHFNAEIIGNTPNKSLILSAPVSDTGKFTTLRKNQRFMVRMLRGNKLFGFEAVVLNYFTQPYQHVHLSQPHNVECFVVRGAQRINTDNLMMSAQAGTDTPVTANIVNISATGALLQCHQPLGKQDDKLAVSLELTISSINKYVRLNSIIRNLSTPEDHKENNNGHYRYGLEFLDTEEDPRLIVNVYVNEQVVKQLED